MIENSLDDYSKVSFHQIWQNKYSQERIEIVSHIFQFLWECKNIRSNKITQITESELLETWHTVNVMEK